MSTYLIGDVQGCDEPLGRLLAQVGFNPGADTAVFLGDLVNRGPDSLAVMRRVTALGSAALCVAGNHDLHALAVWHGLRRESKGDTLGELIAAPDAKALFSMIASWPLALQTEGWLCVHAGVLPQWDTTKIIALSADFTMGDAINLKKNMLSEAFGNLPAAWREDLSGADRFRVIINAFTRLRFCSAEGAMEFATKTDIAPAGYLPWFESPGRATADMPIAFGHWSTLGLLQRPHLLGLDTGCVWGGKLTAARLRGANQPPEIVQVSGHQPRTPNQM
jgi:bis(5'-nucleosyl)-tetraphosphatase (symmetrical)